MVAATSPTLFYVTGMNGSNVLCAIVTNGNKFHILSDNNVLQHGWSSLVIASLNGHLDIVMALIGAGANVNQTNKVVE